MEQQNNNCLMCRRGLYHGRYQRHLLTDNLPETRPELAAYIQDHAVLENLQLQVVTFVLATIICTALANPYPKPQMSDAQLEQTLADRATMIRHLKCATGEGQCDPVGRRLRTLAPLVLRGACPQCTAQETNQIRRTLAHIQRNYPWEWAKIVRQYG